MRTIIFSFLCRFGLMVVATCISHRCFCAAPPQHHECGGTPASTLSATAEGRRTIAALTEKAAHALLTAKIVPLTKAALGPDKNLWQESWKSITRTVLDVLPLELCEKVCDIYRHTHAWRSGFIATSLRICAHEFCFSHSVCISPRGKYVMACCGSFSDGAMAFYVIDTKSSTIVREFRLGGGNIRLTHVDVTDNGCAIIGDRGVVFLGDGHTGVIRKFDTPLLKNSPLLFAHTGHRQQNVVVVYDSSNGHVRTVDLERGAVLKDIDYSRDIWLDVPVALLCDGRLAMSRGAAITSMLDTGTHTVTPTPFSYACCCATCPAINGRVQNTNGSNGRWLVASAQDSPTSVCAFVYDACTNTTRHVSYIDPSEPFDVTPKGPYLVVRCSDCSSVLVSPVTRFPLHRARSTANVPEVAHTGGTMATVQTAENTITLWHEPMLEALTDYCENRLAAQRGGERQQPVGSYF